MRWITAGLALLLLLLSATWLTLVVLEPDIVRIMAGFSGLRWRVVAAMAGGSLLLIALVAGWYSSRFRRVMAGAAALVVAIGLLVLWMQRPSYGLEPVRYQAGDAELVGELYRPTATGPLPAVVLVHGSAPFPRAVYDRWADFLAEAGFAVLLVDKRGVGDSGGVFESENNAALRNLQRLADDVIAGATFLQGRDDIDPQRIGLYGISQAGWVGVLAATRSPIIRFMMFNSGPTVSIGEENAWSRLRGDDQRAAEVTQAEAEMRITEVAPAGYDPRKDLAELAIPGFWQFGAVDNSIPTAKSAAVLEDLIDRGKPFEQRTYPHVGHVLLGLHGGGGMSMPAASWEDLIDWARRRQILR